MLVMQVAAGQVEPSYYVYEYRVERVDRSVVSGRMRVTATDLDEGRIRLKVELTFNDGTASIEKDVPESAFVVPVLPGVISPGSFSYSNGNYSVNVSVQAAGGAQREVGGRTYRTTTYAVYAVARTPDDRRFTVNSSIEIVETSRVIYSMTASLTSQTGGVWSLNYRLVDTNLDLTSIRTPQNTLSVEQLFMPPFVQEYIATGRALTEPRYSSGQPISQVTTPTQTPDDQSFKLAIIGAAGIAAIAAASALTVRGVRRPHGTEGVKRKPYYV